MTNDPKIQAVPLGTNTEKHPPAVTTSKQQIRRMEEIKSLSYEELDTAKIIYPGMTDVKTLNTFRELRTTLMQKAKKTNFSVMVSSLAPEGGSTYISENLAASIALDFEKTALLVTCCNSFSKHDQQIFSATDYGLTDYIEDTTLAVSDIIYSSGIPRLRKTPLGNHGTSGSEFFLSERMGEFIKEVRSRYEERYIIIDAPPVNSSSDARILADLCDFTVLVVPYGKVTNLQIIAGINSIPSKKFAGLVFNN